MGTLGTSLRVVAALGLVLGVTPAQSADLHERGLVGGKTAIELNGKQAGWVFNALGGTATAEVVSEPTGADRVTHKHVTNVKYDDIAVNCGAGMSREFYGLVKAGVEGTSGRFSGAIVVADYDYKESSRITFANALVTEIAFPALDASSKEAGRMLVTFSPQYTRLVAGSGQRSTQSGSLTPGGQKKWLTSSFKLAIDGLDTTRVIKIEPLTAKTAVVNSAVGSQREPTKEATKIQYSNLVFYVPETAAKPFLDWHDAFVIRGQNAQANEKNGRLEMLTQDLRTALFTLDFTGIGIVGVAPEPPATGESVRRMRVEMYIETMKLTADPSASQ